MTDKEKLIQQVEKSLSKWQLRAERCRGFRNANDERYSEFNFGKCIGYTKAYSEILSFIKNELSHEQTI